jgi:hypothetical protein
VAGFFGVAQDLIERGLGVRARGRSTATVVPGIAVPSA